MPFNGSGTFNRVYNWVTDKVNGVNITASRMDGDSDGFAAALSNCVTRDGQGKMGATLSPGSDAAYDLGSPSARWRNASLSGTATAQDYLQTVGRILKTAQESRSSTNTPTADSTLLVVPVAVGSYIIRARMLFTAASSAAGIRVGLFANNLNFNSGLITAHGLINGSLIAATATTFSSPYVFPAATAPGFAANWIEMTAAINILNITGSPLMGVQWSQNISTAATLIAESGSYLEFIRVT